MKTIVIAPDSFKGSLSAAEVAASIATGLRRVRPDDECIAVDRADLRAPQARHASGPLGLLRPFRRRLVFAPPEPAGGLTVIRSPGCRPPTGRCACSRWSATIRRFCTSGSTAGRILSMSKSFRS